MYGYDDIALKRKSFLVGQRCSLTSVENACSLVIFRSVLALYIRISPREQLSFRRDLFPLLWFLSFLSGASEAVMTFLWDGVERIFRRRVRHTNLWCASVSPQGINPNEKRHFSGVRNSENPVAVLFTFMGTKRWGLYFLSNCREKSHIAEEFFKTYFD